MKTREQWQLDIEQVQVVYNYRNPDDQLPYWKVVEILQQAHNKLHKALAGRGVQ
jgi:hypothetical protein